MPIDYTDFIGQEIDFDDEVVFLEKGEFGLSAWLQKGKLTYVSDYTVMVDGKRITKYDIIKIPSVKKYKPLSDSTLMGMTKKQIIDRLRSAEYNLSVTQTKRKNEVLVVRCSECKYHRENEGFHFCKRLGVYSPDDSEFFCKWGERR